MKRLSVLAALSVLLVGCRLAPGSSVPQSAAASGVEVAVEPSPSTSGQEAPEACGFPPGAALEFAGRSTYAELRVGDAKGDRVDPMSDDPADIYVTRDTFNQGEVHGRLVCAIFVDQPDFVEVTVHPEDWGKFTPAPEPGSPANGLSSEQAIEVARAALPEGDEWYIELQGPGPIGDYSSPDYRDYDWGRELTADQWVWAVSAERGTKYIVMFIDYVEGTVVGTIESTLDECGRHSGDPEYGTEDCPDL